MRDQIDTGVDFNSPNIAAKESESLRNKKAAPSKGKSAKGRKTEEEIKQDKIKEQKIQEHMR